MNTATVKNPTPPLRVIACPKDTPKNRTTAALHILVNQPPREGISAMVRNRRDPAALPVKTKLHSTKVSFPCNSSGSVIS
ncbi:hypothetical protein BDFB_011601 [Asbolus verrucosus]|uniref:Uncharacterized protein n=1 Tax=Asbolus verrucosus TaxID=1661398 RepID=A0A482VQ05_ASBVE|nr:hypothetical protein BDFB_011601 [Asbolus verrucosus]